MKALQKLYKKVTIYMLLKVDVDFNISHTFKMWVNEYFLNSWHYHCETRMRIIRKVQMLL